LKVLFIGGTGNISTSVSKMCIAKGIDLYLLNRGKQEVIIPKAKLIKGDINDSSTKSKLQKHDWDVVVDWIAFAPKDIERDIKLFQNKTKQYIFISSASIYQKPPTHFMITESTPLSNPYWDYSQNKIMCEEKLISAYRTKNFPITIVRPSHTYDTIIPIAIGDGKEYTVIDRMLKGKQIIVHGDGTSFWTLTHAEDFAKGFVGLLGHQQAIGNAFHITSDEILTWNQIYETIGNVLNVKPNIVHIASDFICKEEKSLLGSLIGDKSVSAIFDNTKIKTFVPDFKAVIPFNQGIQKTLTWFEADEKRMIIKKETNQMIDRIINAYMK
jgi:nucleoside-diphosphate-sugar epimerase